MTPAPRWYQRDLIDKTRAAWAAGARDVVVVSPPRSGKTKMAVWTSEPFLAQNVPVFMQAHRAELVKQIANEYAEHGHMVDVLAPSDVVAAIVHQQTKSLGRSFVRRGAPMVVGSVQTVLARAESLPNWASRVGLWITDECFPAGTLVDGRPIEDIRVGDVVSAFNETTGRIEQRTVTDTFTRLMPKNMVRLDIGHHVLHATPNHPIYTRRGWVNAEEVRTTDDVLLHVRSAGKPQTCDDEVLQADGSPILQHDLFDEVSEHDQFRNDGTDQSEICIGAHDTKQPDGEVGNPSQGVKHASGDWSQAENQRREWSATDRGGIETDGPVRPDRVRLPIRRGDGTSEGSGSATLQDRLCQPITENCDRSGRAESRFSGTASVGCEEGFVLEWAGVDCVSILEHGNPDFPAGGVVYNIEVDTVHTYIANGIVVHNCHHCLADNQWGKVIQMFPNALGLGFSATPARTDRKSLARSQGGVFDAMVKGVTARQLIDEGHICEYRIIAPPSSIDRNSIRVGSTGDFTQAGLTDARKHSTITGDAVASYRRYTPDENAIVFAVDIQHATELCAAYRDAGISAEAVSSKTPAAVRAALMDKFERGVFRVLVNVDLFGEGLNVKGISAVIMCRPTQSFVLYVQQFFRALTKADGKHIGTIIDHAGNVGYFGKIYGLPDTYNGWVLESDERGRRGVRDPDTMPVTTCVECFTPYDGTLSECPFCGHKPEPIGRSKPEQVDGDLVELSPDVLAALRSEIARISGEPQVPGHLDQIASRALVRRWNERRDAQSQLRETMALWCGVRREAGDTDRQMQKRFFFTFGIDMATAQTLNASDAEALMSRLTSVSIHGNSCQ